MSGFGSFGAGGFATPATKTTAAGFGSAPTKAGGFGLTPGFATATKAPATGFGATAAKPGGFGAFNASTAGFSAAKQPSAAGGFGAFNAAPIKPAIATPAPATGGFGSFGARPGATAGAGVGGFGSFNPQTGTGFSSFTQATAAQPTAGFAGLGGFNSTGAAATAAPNAAAAAANAAAARAAAETAATNRVLAQLEAVVGPDDANRLLELNNGFLNKRHRQYKLKCLLACLVPPGTRVERGTDSPIPERQWKRAQQYTKALGERLRALDRELYGRERPAGEQMHLQPLVVLGFEGLRQHIARQDSHVVRLASAAATLTRALSAVRAATDGDALRLAQCRRNQQRLQHRLLQVMKKVQLLQARRVPLVSEEVDFAKRVQALHVSLNGDARSRRKRLSVAAALERERVARSRGLAGHSGGGSVGVIGGVGGGGGSGDGDFVGDAGKYDPGLVARLSALREWQMQQVGAVAGVAAAGGVGGDGMAASTALVPLDGGGGGGGGTGTATASSAMTAAGGAGGRGRGRASNQPILSLSAQESARVARFLEQQRQGLALLSAIVKKDVRDLRIMEAALSRG